MYVGLKIKVRRNVLNIRKRIVAFLNAEKVSLTKIKVKDW